MAKTKHSTSSAAQRRDNVRQQRGLKKQGKRTSHIRRQQHFLRWKWISIIVLAIFVIVGFFIFLSGRQQSGSLETATPGVWKTITTVDPQTLANVGTGSSDPYARQLFFRVKDPPEIWKGAENKPRIFYMGGEFCPYCAAQRWSMIVALSRFGILHPLTPLLSGESNIPTYSFRSVSYDSQYIDFTPVETKDNQFPNPQDLDKLTPEEEAVVAKYDVPPYTPASSAGAFPFISIAKQYSIPGALYDLNVLKGKSYQEIADQLAHPQSPVAQGILGGANYLTAAFCNVTGNQPAAVCQNGPVPEIQTQIAQKTPIAYKEFLIVKKGE